ncbi:type VII secretion-associated protein [Allosaccharopolyspora coralli]|uniref:Type VII secretion-associated protein n=1 Tax=Allosaccharopolyspora coralli TaxID=2665642 RepID=A0A5Q3QAI5_9PSEU|nr:type VII secretion-associated protein [Allosaccharopolyspora coralli]QGK71492.1 type VII secretion-associated protein [Allosaccharopolyspora coralli]
MTLHVAVDFGTSSTCTVVSRDGAEPQVVVIDGQPLVPSAVFAAADGTLFVGQEAERQAAVDPARFEPHPKRRIDDGELLLGSSVLPVVDVIRAVLQRAVGEARRYAGGAAVDLLVLTHPADWGSVRTSVLRAAAQGLGRESVLVPEPVAAAVFHSAGHGLPDGGALAVLDLGGGTVDASVVRKQGSRFPVLATKGRPDFGGADIDQALLEHLGRTVSHVDPGAWHQLVEGREMVDRRRRRVLRQDVRGAKETLSRHAYTDVPMPPPFSDAHVTRTDLERLVAGGLSQAVDLVPGTLREGSVPRQQLAGVFLVGGSSRIPMVSRLVHERTGVVPTTLDQPETVVARGALRAVRLDPDRTGGLPAAAVRGPATPTRAPGVAGAQSPGFAAPQQVTAPEAGSVPASDSLSRASTIVIGGNERTRQVNAPSTPAKPNRTPWLVGAGAAVLVVSALVVGILVIGEDGDARQQAGRTVAQYDYEFEYPATWRQSGGDPEQWQTLIEPRSSATGGGRIAVQEGRLDYDAGADRERAVNEVRGLYDAGVAETGTFSGFRADASFGGKDVVHYREQLPQATVDWFVVHAGTARVSVGCQYTPQSGDEVRRACEQVVRSLTVRD